MLRRVGPREPGAGERGSVAVFTAVFAFAVLLLLALLVDGGNALNARERAADLAEQAARAAATDLSIPALRANPSTVLIDWNTACGYAAAAVRGFSEASVSMTMTYCGPPRTGAANPDTTATVSVQVSTTPIFLGFGAMTATVTQSATAACGNADQQE